MKIRSLWICLFIGYVSGNMLTHDCPLDEMYKSCMFYAEYTCWQNKQRDVRIKTPAKRLFHCWGGCVCKYGSVRAYPNGPCIQAHRCRDGYFVATLAKLPADFVYF